MPSFKAFFLGLAVAVPTVLAATPTSSQEIHFTMMPIADATQTVDISDSVAAANAGSGRTAGGPVVAAGSWSQTRKTATTNNSDELIGKREGNQCLSATTVKTVGDCDNLCNFFLNNPTRSTDIPAGQLASWYSESCRFSAGNTDGCHDTSIGFNAFNTYCEIMVLNCMVYGLDGYYTADNSMIYAMTGVDVAASFQVNHNC
ncbi:hypothetical protein SPI_02571 [Niveomyces insectorum RCEF 264]|uniref:Uncharacterized protein n=1 Tax=Niveomyces insectorum RCEF 264 TaxID=1081102 RepID=A0A167Y3G0_9HYPO|nr:hypothetical protein SPI_02571 [Niveomyces insectorum RCEF 264]